MISRWWFEPSGRTVLDHLSFAYGDEYRGDDRCLEQGVEELNTATSCPGWYSGCSITCVIHSGTKPTPESPSRNPCFRTRVVERLGELNVHLGYAEQYIYCLHDTCIPQQCWSLLPFHSPSRSHRSRSFVNKTTQHSTTFEFNHAIGNEVRHPGCYCAGDVRGCFASIQRRGHKSA